MSSLANKRLAQIPNPNINGNSNHCCIITKHNNKNLHNSNLLNNHLKNSILGYNHIRPKQLKFVHAEEDAIIKFIKKYNRSAKKIDLDLLVIRVNSTGILRNSKPCQHCILKMYQLNIINIFYSDDFGNIECIKFKNLYHNQHLCTISKGNR